MENLLQKIIYGDCLSKYYELLLCTNKNYSLKNAGKWQNFNWSTSFNDSKTVSANNLILNGVDPLLTNTTSSYYNTNFSTFMAICAALQSHSCKASYVMKMKVKSVGLCLQENTQSTTFYRNTYLWVTSNIIAQHRVRTTAVITRCTLYASLWLN
jgi:hypothetical protein